MGTLDGLNGTCVTSGRAPGSCDVAADRADGHDEAQAAATLLASFTLPFTA